MENVTRRTTNKSSAPIVNIDMHTQKTVIVTRKSGELSNANFSLRRTEFSDRRSAVDADQIAVAILMGIREELQKLNKLLDTIEKHNRIPFRRYDK